MKNGRYIVKVRNQHWLKDNTHVWSVEEFYREMFNYTSFFLVNKWNFNNKSLQINDNEKYEESPTEHTEIGIVGPGESLNNCVSFWRFCHQEMNKTYETAFKLYTVFRWKCYWTEHLPKDDLRCICDDKEWNSRAKAVAFFKHLI